MVKYYAGIDVSKSFHVCYVIDENEKVVGNIKFNNDNDGYKKFFEFITSIDNELDKFSIALEATGIYFENLFLFLKKNFAKLFIINPYMSNKFREFSNMNKVKNDNIDALLLALLISKNKFSSSYLSENVLAELKFLNRHKLEKRRLLRNYKKELSDVLVVVFPEYTKVFKNIFSKTSLTLLKLYPTAFHFQNLTPKKLVKHF